MRCKAGRASARVAPTEGYKECDGAGRCGHRPLRKRIMGCVGEGLCPSHGRGKTPPLRMRYKGCGTKKNPPVTASPCQPPLGKGARGPRGRIATPVNRSLVRNDSFLHGVWCMAGGRPRGSPLRITSKSLLRADVGIGPYGGETEIRPLSGGRGRTPPLRMRYKGCNGRTEASAPTDTSIDNCQWPVA